MTYTYTDNDEKRSYTYQLEAVYGHSLISNLSLLLEMYQEIHSYIVKINTYLVIMRERMDKKLVCWCQDMEILEIY